MKKKDINVCSQFRDERKRLNFSQEDIAHMCDVTSKTVGRWERSIPIPSDKLSILQLLGFDVLYVLSQPTETSDLNMVKIAEEKTKYRINTDTYSMSDAHITSRTQRPTCDQELGHDELQWLEWFRQIKPEDRELVEPIVKGFAERSNTIKKETG